MKKLHRKNGFSYCLSGGAGRSVAHPPPPPNQKFVRGSLLSVIAITDVFNITCDIGDFKAHISCPH